MMTFVIRNGLKALELGLQTYLSYVNNLAKNWGLAPHQVMGVPPLLCLFSAGRHATRVPAESLLAS